ncbi:hypothetical protein WN51_02023 [Melipona quadrifasciata]|uniref:Uncharacterized protein n=1 Tax=Melipona quadrifasciata TaxID=166423 RepID=A0A0M9AAT1_9HYME|nr:hypothetical protein WN51_02023 [Melipona quadrifasciata]
MPDLTLLMQTFHTSDDSSTIKVNVNALNAQQNTLQIFGIDTQRPRIPQIRVSNTRLAQAASGCAPSVDVLPIFDVKQQSVRDPARMGANQPYNLDARLVLEREEVEETKKTSTLAIKPTKFDACRMSTKSSEFLAVWRNVETLCASHDGRRREEITSVASSQPEYLLKTATLPLIFVHHRIYSEEHNRAINSEKLPIFELFTQNAQMQIARKLYQKHSFDEQYRFKITPATLNWKVYGYFARKLRLKDSVCQDEFNRVHDV